MTQKIDEKALEAAAGATGNAMRKAADVCRQYAAAMQLKHSPLSLNIPPEVIAANFLADQIAALSDAPQGEEKRTSTIGEGWRFDLGDKVYKPKGASWRGKVVGFYSSSLTEEGYAIESENEPGSVQILPLAALAPVANGGK